MKKELRQANSLVIIGAIGAPYLFAHHEICPPKSVCHLAPHEQVDGTHRDPQPPVRSSTIQAITTTTSAAASFGTPGFVKFRKI